jgi:hypothetical protein
MEFRRRHRAPPEVKLQTAFTYRQYECREEGNVNERTDGGILRQVHALHGKAALTLLYRCHSALFHCLA